MKSIRLFGYNINKINYHELIKVMGNSIRNKKPMTLTLLNPYIILEAKKHKDYNEYIKSCKIITPDGYGLLLGARLFGHQFLQRLTGTDLMPRLARVSAEQGWKLYFFGARPGIAQKAADNFKSSYPKLKIVGIRHGFFSVKDEVKIVQDIKRKRPDILIVCLGAYRQEMFIAKYRKELKVPVAFGNGAAFDFWAGIFKRAPKWMQDLGLEWLFRLMQEPGRLWKRYLIGNFVFFWYLLQDLIRIKIFKEKI